MVHISETVIKLYRAFLERKGIAAASHADFIKWLRYYLDFCEKYPSSGTDSERLRRYMEKLREKNQGEDRRRQAAHAVVLFLEMAKTTSFEDSAGRYPGPQESAQTAGHPAPGASLERLSQYREGATLNRNLNRRLPLPLSLHSHPPKRPLSFSGEAPRTPP